MRNNNSNSEPQNARKYFLYALILPVWYLIYSNLQAVADYITFNLLQMPAGEHLTEAIRFFIFEVPKVLLLLTLIVFFVGILRSFFSAEKTRKMLEGKPLFVGNVMAASLGIVTPFCSCSAIPLFLGFVEAGIPIGVTFSFLIAAPMINEVAIVLLLGMFGWKTALIYVSSGLFIAILSGWVIGRLRMERFVQDWVYSVKSNQGNLPQNSLTWDNRVEFAFTAVRDIVSKVWIYIVIGIGVGAAAHGYVPTDFMAQYMGRDVWYSIPLVVLLGIPMYGNAAGIVPIVQVLLSKGASLGSALAFMMAIIGLSLPEGIILKKVLKLPLLFAFFGVTGVGIMLVGYLFNYLF